jgi:hypothetical protein
MCVAVVAMGAANVTCEASEEDDMRKLSGDYLVWAQEIAAIAKGEFSVNEAPRLADLTKRGEDFHSPIWEFTDNRVYEEAIEETPIWEFGKRHFAKELVRKESMQPLNVDVPDDKYLYEMGCGLRRNESLDHRAMDDRDFRERCIVVNGRLYALYEKRKVDLQPRSDLRQEVVAGMLPDANYEDVDRFVRFCRSMRFSRKTVLALIHGYVRPDEDGTIARSSGLKALDAAEFAEIVDELEAQQAELAEYDIPEPETNMPRTLNDERAYWHDVALRLYDQGKFGDGFPGLLAQIRFIETNARRDFDEGYYEDPARTPDSFTIYTTEEGVEDTVLDPMNEEEELLEWDPEMEKVAMAIDSNAFGAHPLYDETSCLSDEFINEIKAADWKSLSEVKSFLMSGESWYLTSDQRKIAWSFVKGRENGLIAESMKRPIAHLVGSYITKTDDAKRACALLFAWKNGERFDTEDTVFKFDEERSLEEDLVAAWTIFRREHRDHQRQRRIEKAKANFRFFAYRDRKPGERGARRVAVQRATPLELEAA